MFQPYISNLCRVSQQQHNNNNNNNTAHRGGGGDGNHTDTRPAIRPSLINSFGSFLFPDRGNIVKVSDPKIPSVEDPFKDLFKPGSSPDPTLSVSQGLGEDRVVFSDNNNNNRDTELKIINVTMMTGEDVTTANNMSDNLELDIKNIGEVIETTDLPTEIIEEDVTDSTVNTRESRLV